MVSLLLNKYWRLLEWGTWRSCYGRHHAIELQGQRGLEIAQKYSSTKGGYYEV
jgi:hypothetical protein